MGTGGKGCLELAVASQNVKEKSMNNAIVSTVILVISGLILTIIGTATLFAPIAFLGTTGIDLGGQINLLSEIRAPGAALLAGGIVILLGVFVAQLRLTSTVIAILMFLSYGLGRFLSIALDGMPAQSIVAATIVEIGLGLANIFVLLNYWKTPGAVSGSQFFKA